MRFRRRLVNSSSGGKATLVADARHAGCARRYPRMPKLTEAAMWFGHSRKLSRFAGRAPRRPRNFDTGVPWVDAEADFARACRRHALSGWSAGCAANRTTQASCGSTK